jgi:hypothetical protein
MSNPNLFLGMDTIASDGNGNALVAGAMTTYPFGLCEGQCNYQGFPSDQSAVVAKLDSATGDLIWFKYYYTGAGEGFTGTAVDTSGNYYAVGFTNGIWADGFTQPTDDFVALKMDSNGNPIWAQQFGTGTWTTGGAPWVGIQATTDTTGNLYVTGSTEDAFPGNTNPNQLGEAFLLKFSAN